MRLIDADELKNQFSWSEVCRLSINEINKIISEVPTITINANAIEHKAYCKGLEDGKKIARPKGKWKPVDAFVVKCSICGAESFATPFCPRCGADMRGDV